MSTPSQGPLLYQNPPEPILSLADAELAPVLKLDVDARVAILLHRKIYRSIAELATEELKLAGLRINPKNNISFRESYFFRITLLDINTSKESNIKGLPETGRFCRVSWNYDYTKAALLNIQDDGVEGWVIDVVNKVAHLITDRNVNGNIGTAFMWLKDDSLLFSIVPASRPQYITRQEELPIGPITAQNDGKAIETRTFQDLLKDELDARNFELAATSEIWKFEPNGNKICWKAAALHDGMALSPDGNLIMLSEINRPFSFFVQYDRFPYTTLIYGLDGNAICKAAENPLLEYLPQGFMAVQSGRRQLRWRSDHAATFVWVEALDGGDPEQEAEFRDAVYQLCYPFDEAPRLLVKTRDRFSGLFFGNESLAIVFERWWSTRTQRTIFFNPESPDTVRIFNERNFQDKYSDPGNFITRKNIFGWNTLHIEENGDMFLHGDGWTHEGRFPFIDKYNLLSGKSERVYQSSLENKQEDISVVIDIKEGKLLTLIQSPFEYPNFYIRNFIKGELNLVRHFENPFKAMEGVKKQVISYHRHDGVELSATLYLPALSLEKGARWPLIMWAYPTEFKDKATAAQKSANDLDFIYPFWGSPLYWVTRGYAVLDDVSFPVIGEGKSQPNESFINQMVANAEAAISKMASLGNIDTDRIGIGGHSYGAFMVSILLTHTRLFSAGIARSGAYNRTLTPFGFQSEERNYWQAKEVYRAMDPFSEADKMKTPLLLIHGQDDNNAGTYTMQTERYYAALKALGATVRMVLLPLESHSYSARESIMHVLWEQDQWFERFVKNGEKSIH
ncbi:MAG: S9 family peptidase [Saprospiraceae bacterium]|nr:S9 family peptidase [Saprospiraceae bacterium]